MTTCAERAYLAGILDGEGCISLHRREVPHPERWSGRGRKPTSWARVDGKVHVVNTDRRLIEWLNERWPGAVRTDANGGGNCKPIHTIGWASRRARPVLEAAMPFLVLKREQAILFLAFIESLGNRGTPLSVETYRAREEIHARMSLLNQKGVPNGTRVSQR